MHLGPGLADAVAQKAYSWPLVSSVPTSTTVGVGRSARSAALNAEVAALQLGIVGELGARSSRRDLPGDHHQLAFGQRGGHAEVLLHDEDRQALLRRGRGRSRSASR